MKCYVQLLIIIIFQFIAMSIHQKMQSDYLWVRHAPVEEGLKTRNHGFFYLYNRAPNSVERIEMIYRSIGKQYDWDIQKFRLGRKGVDRGNKRRFIKNALRFIKHPLGYLHWKLHSFMRVPPKLIVLMLGFTIVLSFLEYMQQSNNAQLNNEFLTSLGKNVQGTAGRMQGYHNRAKIRSFNVFDTFLKAPLTSDLIVLNPTWRQNLRKQLQLTNSYKVSFV